MKPGRRCRVHECKFVAVGELHAVSAIRAETHVFGLCAVHVDGVITGAMTNPAIEQVIWQRRDDWSDDGAEAAA